MGLGQTVISHPVNETYGVKRSDSTMIVPTICIIPQPTVLEEQKGSFAINSKTTLVIPENNEVVRKTARLFTDQLLRVDGTNIKIKGAKAPHPSKNVILFELEGTQNGAGDEASEWYRLEMNEQVVKVIAGSPKGFFYAIQTLLQLLPPTVFSNTPLRKKAGWLIPCVHVEDQPRYAYRGLHLDVGRHFFPTSFIKRFIDLMAMHKLNVFHWHLTDDQGWRIEIKKYPKLTEIGSKRKGTIVGKNFKPLVLDDIPYGGFYTQAEIKEVVAYAQSRFVTIVPEIEMPGHALAALSAYPELSCDSSRTYEAATKWGVFEDVFCPSEKTFGFLEDVLTEVMALFPGKYIHIGGDECPKTAWKKSTFCQDLIKKEGLKDEHELQSYFIRRIERFINSKGKSIIGWDEILEGGLSPNATVMSWRGIKGGIEAARQLHDVVMTPTSSLYLDYYQFDAKKEPLAIGGFLPLEKVYAYEPTPDSLTEEQGKHILGAQANLWSEYMTTGEQVEYMVFPRACALSELVWSPKSKRDFKDFKGRLSVHRQRLGYLGVHYCDLEFGK